MSEHLFKRIRPLEAEIVQEAIRQRPVKVGALAQSLGLRVTRSSGLKPTISGLIRPASDTPSGYEILVNKYEVPERQRFTVAHEISHYLLHRDDIGAGVVDSVMYRSSLSSRKETEANQLAAAIIMPAAAVTREMNELGSPEDAAVVQELAELFRVSVPAMKIRLGVA
ncbi:ImmA/IrrE family metallo-endopeptidase [Hyphomonas beringensis]|uniref:ImmA/IrrE family metallo-endopeptidase n=1 Tax=Hyphomonas beringensis TaxID=1280946 RepID=UPI000551A3D6|nr:ImmA/IrrE family metallo-endopeptidase [Hyphomonas beringensis]